MVVLPVPAGPHRISDGRWPPSNSDVSAFPGPNRCRCPTSSSKLRGRIRVASGASAMATRAYRTRKGGPRAALPTIGDALSLRRQVAVDVLVDPSIVRAFVPAPGAHRTLLRVLGLELTALQDV